MCARRKLSSALGSTDPNPFALSYPGVYTVPKQRVLNELYNTLKFVKIDENSVKNRLKRVPRASGVV